MFDWLRSKWVAAFLVMWLFPIGPLIVAIGTKAFFVGLVEGVWILFVIATIAAHLHHHFLSRKKGRMATLQAAPTR